ncbi:MAG: dephospho-CoA kinase [Proteobacteria bacterium]|nr:dephospho-CoA kinase [Pseudomonadota bacterium]MBU4235750.1 dephospho-CoA kinase [Pseudomonadota bacterium]MBU4326972.1 dephospho-CoA kinase [Pseudomonadota bacterium]
MIIGVTGGMGSGKSFVAGLLGRLLGVDVLNADILCRDLLQMQRPGWQGIQERWGSRFLDLTGNIDRTVLRKVLFAEPEVRRGVEQILHPLVRQEIISRATEERVSLEGMVAEVPLLFEVGWQNDFDWIVVVYSEYECRVQRIVRRDRVSLEEGRSAISAQISLEEKALQADSVIENSGPLALTILQVYHLAHLLSS